MKKTKTEFTMPDIIVGNPDRTTFETISPGVKIEFRPEGLKFDLPDGAWSKGAETVEEYSELTVIVADIRMRFVDKPEILFFFHNERTKENTACLYSDCLFGQIKKHRLKIEHEDRLTATPLKRAPDRAKSFAADPLNLIFKILLFAAAFAVGTAISLAVESVVIAVLIAVLTSNYVLSPSLKQRRLYFYNDFFRVSGSPLFRTEDLTDIRIEAEINRSGKEEFNFVFYTKTFVVKFPVYERLLRFLKIRFEDIVRF